MVFHLNWLHTTVTLSKEIYIHLNRKLVRIYLTKNEYYKNIQELYFHYDIDI